MMKIVPKMDPILIPSVEELALSADRVDMAYCPKVKDRSMQKEINVEIFRGIRPGLTGAEVIRRVGKPETSQDMGGVHLWYYLNDLVEITLFGVDEPSVSKIILKKKW